MDIRYTLPSSPRKTQITPKRSLVDREKSYKIKENEKKRKQTERRPTVNKQALTLFFRTLQFILSL